MKSLVQYYLQSGATVNKSQYPKGTLSSEIVFEAFSEVFRLQVHLLLAWGYEYARAQIESDDENDITDLLYQSIRHILRSGRATWCDNYSVHNEAPISGGKHTGKARRSIDLLIEYVTLPGRPEYVFEAKPLNYPKRYQRVGNYVGRDGVKRFLSGEYADYTANYPEVGMLGYVLSDTLEHWRKDLKKVIDNKSTQLRLKGPQQDVHLIDAFPLEWVSQHERDSNDHPITIYHILLDCLPRQRDAASPDLDSSDA